MAMLEVTTLADAGPGSLRQAILDANASPGGDDIATTGATAGGTVRLLSALPAITDTVSLSDLTLDGSEAGPVSGGLAIAPGAAGSQVSRLTAANFEGAGFLVSAANVRLTNVDARLNDGGGVLAAGAGTTVAISNSRIGTDATGTADLGNRDDGVRARDGASISFESSITAFNRGAGAVAVGAGSRFTAYDAKVLSNHSHGIVTTDGGAGFVGGFRSTNPVQFPNRLTLIGNNGGSGVMPSSALPKISAALAWKPGPPWT